MQQATQQRRQPTNRPVTLTDEHKAILVKWNFTNRAHVPPGVEIRDRVSDQDVDRITQKKALAVGDNMVSRAEVGRVRPNRTDTTDPSYGDEHDMVRIGFTRRALRDLGYYLKDLYAYLHRQPGKMDKYVVVAVFERRNAETQSTIVTAPQRQALELLEKRTAWTLWVYDNLDLDAAANGTTSRVVTVNLVRMNWLTHPDGRPNGNRPREMLVVRNGALTVVPFEVRDADMQ